MGRGCGSSTTSGRTLCNTSAGTLLVDDGAWLDGDGAEGGRYDARVRDLPTLPALKAYLAALRSTRSVDGALTERVAVAARAAAGGGRWRQPMRLPHWKGQTPSNQMQIGRGVFVGKHAWINLTNPQSRLTIGDGVVINDTFTAGVGSHITIGDGVLMSDRCTVLDQLHDFRSWVTEAVAQGRPPTFDWRLTEAEPVSIGAGTWLGIGVVVLPGVTIGQGCAIGANSVVTTDVPDHAIAVGAPARVIGSALDHRPNAAVPQL